MVAKTCYLLCVRVVVPKTWLSVCVVYLCALFVFFVLFMCVRVLFVYVVLNQYVFVRVFVCVFFSVCLLLKLSLVTVRRSGRQITACMLYVHRYLLFVLALCVCIMCVHVFIGMHVCASMHFCVCIFVYVLCVYMCVLMCCEHAF